MIYVFKGEAISTLKPIVFVGAETDRYTSSLPSTLSLDTASLVSLVKSKVKCRE